MTPRPTNQADDQMLRTSTESRIELYNALLAIVRQNARDRRFATTTGYPPGRDVIRAARAALAYATFRTGKRIDWAKEKGIQD